LGRSGLQYIAVRDGGVMYHGGSMKELLDRILERDELSEFTGVPD
jgi:hypothetical protein